MKKLYFSFILTLISIKIICMENYYKQEINIPLPSTKECQEYLPYLYDYYDDLEDYFMETINIATENENEFKEKSIFFLKTIAQLSKQNIFCQTSILKLKNMFNNIKKTNNILDNQTKTLLKKINKEIVFFEKFMFLNTPSLYNLENKESGTFIEEICSLIEIWICHQKEICENNIDKKNLKKINKQILSDIKFIIQNTLFLKPENYSVNNLNNQIIKMFLEGNESFYNDLINL